VHNMDISNQAGLPMYGVVGQCVVLWVGGWVIGSACYGLALA
jgi:hypothetical protein